MASFARREGVLALAGILIAFALSGALGKTPSTASAAAEKTVSTALQAWKNEQWRRMYNCLSKKDRSETPFSKFEQTRRAVNSTDKLVGYKILGSKTVSKGEVLVTVRMSSIVVADPAMGAVRQTGDRTFRVVKESAEVWKIAFADH